jgi:hypothetical protein
MTLNAIWIEVNQMQILKVDSNFKFHSNSIEKKWDANWCIRYWKSFCAYGIVKKYFQIHIKKDTFPFEFPMNWLNIFQFGIVLKKETYGT